MKDELHTDRDARLRALLRDADPAAGDRLAPNEVWAFRRTALEAAEKAGRRAWLSTARLAAAAAGIAAAVALWVFQVRPEAPTPARTPPRIAAAPSPVASRPAAVPSRPAIARPAPTRSPLPKLAPAPAPAPPVPAALPAAIAAAEPAAEPRPLQIQFAAPGGTRIIWVLTEESES